MGVISLRPECWLHKARWEEQMMSCHQCWVLREKGPGQQEMPSLCYPEGLGLGRDPEVPMETT